MCKLGMCSAVSTLVCNKAVLSIVSNVFLCLAVSVWTITQLSLEGGVNMAIKHTCI